MGQVYHGTHFAALERILLEKSHLTPQGRAAIPPANGMI
jgi:hypothetical protein